jgi:hypothetical protein
MIGFRCAGRVLAAVAVSMLSLAGCWPAGAVTARFAPPPGRLVVPHPVTITRTRTVTVGGMPGWQIVLIAAVAALLAAAAAVLLDRARAARRA